MRCNCGYTFALSPLNGGGWTDGKFIAVVDRASANGTYAYTYDMLYATYARRATKSHPGRVAFCGTVAAAVAICATAMGGPAQLTATAAGVAVVLFIMMCAALCRRAPDRSALEQAVQVWTGARGKLKGSITESGLHEPPPQYAEADIYDYGVERLFIVERRLLVDLFVRNGLHAQERALILSTDGYPEYLMPVAQKILAESPELPVFFAHDAGSGSGTWPPVAMPWLDGHAQIDIGLQHEDVGRLACLKFTRRPQLALIPLDMIPYQTLTTMLSMAFTYRVPLSILLDERAAKSQGIPSSSSNGGDSHFG